MELNTSMPQAQDIDLLHGWGAIAAACGGIKPSQARHLAKTAGLPVFKLGGKTVAARRSSLNKWLTELEETANGKRS